MNKDFEVVILSACRTPIGSFGGALKELSAADLGALVVREAIARAGVSHDDIGDVVLGCVLQAGAGMPKGATGVAVRTLVELAFSSDAWK